MIIINKNEVLNDASKVYNEEVENYGIIQAGTFNAKVINVSGGVIEGGVFSHVENKGDITGGDFNLKSHLKNAGHIYGGVFNGGYIDNHWGTIEGGVFHSNISNYDGSSIKNGDFYDKVTIYGGTVLNGAFHNTISVGNGGIVNATLKDGAKLTAHRGADLAFLDNIKVDGNASINDRGLAIVKNLEVSKDSVLSIKSFDDLKKIHGDGKVAINNKIWDINEIKQILGFDKPVKIQKAINKIQDIKEQSDILYSVNEQNDDAHAQIALLANGQNGDILI